MSLAALRSEVAACRAWERTLHAGSESTRRAAALPGRAELLLPLVLPAYGLLAWGTGIGFSHEAWIALTPWWILFQRGRLFPRTAPTEWEALRLPSRRAWLLARWSLRLPLLLHLGACTAGLHLLLGLREVPHPEGIRWGASASLILAPFLVASLVSWFPLQERAFGGRSWVAPLCALAFALFLLGAAALVLWSGRKDPEVRRLVAGGLALGGAAILALAAPSLLSLRRAGARYGGGSGIGTLALHGSIGLAGLLPALTILCIGLVPGGAVRGEATDGGASAALVLLAGTSLLGILATALHSLRLVRRADVGVAVRPPARTRTGSRPAPARPGRGLRGAAWAIVRGRWRNLQHPRLALLPVLLWECRAPVCGAIGVGILAFGAGTGGFRGLLSIWLGGVFLAVIPSPLRLPASHRLHLLGADFAAVALHNLRWGILLAVLPAAAGGALPLLLLGSKGAPPFLAFAGAWAGAVGFLLLREGAGAAPAVRVAALGGGVGLALLGAAAAAGWLLDAPLALGVIGVALLAVAAESAYRESRDPQAAGRRLAAGAAND